MKNNKTLWDWICENVPDVVPSPLDVLIANERVMQLFEGLTERQETVLYWRLKGMKEVEIAKIMNCGQSTVSEHLTDITDIVSQNLRQLK